MKQYIKYLCAVLLVIVTSAHAWATTETLDFTQCWGIGTSDYENGTYSFGGYAIEGNSVKYNTYSPEHLMLNYYRENDVQRVAWGSVILPHFSGVISSIQVSTPSNAGSGTRTVELYVNGELYANSSGIAAGSSYTFTSLSIAANSTVELRNSTVNNEFHLSSIVITHNGSQLGQATPANGTIAIVVDGCGTVSASNNPVAHDATSTLTATPASGWAFDYWEITTTQGLCQNWQYEQDEFTSGNVSPNNTSATTVTLTNNTYASVFKVVAHFVETTCTNTPIISFASASVTKKFNAAAGIYQAASITGKGAGQTLAYSSSNTSIATVNSSNGTVTLTGALGHTTITASVLENGDYCAAEGSYTLTVEGYDVTYHYPTCATGKPTNLTNQKGSLTLPTGLAVDGYQFVGWTTNGSYSNNSTPPTLQPASITVSANVDLYAVWRKVSSKFLKMAANTTLTAGDYVICTNYTGAATVMTNNLDGSKRMTTNSSDYTFDGEGNLSCNDEECIWTITGSTGNWVLYNSSSRKYLSANNGTTDSSDRQMRLADNSNTNYEKWIIAQKDASTVPYQVRNKGRVAANSSDNGLNASSGKIGYYANTGSLYFFKRTSTANAYTINPDCDAAEYTVIFDLSTAPTGTTVTAAATGATFSSPVLSPVTAGTAVTIGVTAGTGYDFSSWTVVSGGASLTSEASKANNGFEMPGANVVLKPNFTPKQYNITYKNKGGTDFTGTPTPSPAKHTYGTETVLPGEFTGTGAKAGYTFAGWYTTNTCAAGTQVTSLGATAYTADITLYALWVIFTDPLAWCPEPEMSVTGTTYITSMYHESNGGMIRGTGQLTVAARNMGISESITLTSNNPDVYFSLSNTNNIKEANANQPKPSITLTTDANGKLNGDEGQTVYVHYMPSALGTGAISDVTVTATYAVPDPDVVRTTHIYVRSMPAQFAVAAKVGNTWYALPANIASASNPAPVQIEVDETNWTAKGPATVGYALWPVKTVNGGGSYTDRGDHWRLVGNNNKALWASTTADGYTINNYAAVTAVGDNVTTAYEWKITTTPTNLEYPATGTWKYNIQSQQANNTRYLNIKTNDIIWGTYTDSYQLTKDMYLLPLTTVTPWEYKVVEWYPTKMLIQTDETVSSPTVTIDGTPVASPTVTAKGPKWYEIGNLPLEANPAKTLAITIAGKTAVKTIPVIISRGTKNISDAPFSTIGKAVYNQTDLVVRDGAVLTVNGSETDNKFHDVTIYPTSKISVPANNVNSAQNKLGVHSLTFFGGIDEIYNGSTYTVNKYGVPELSLKGKFGEKTVTKIDYVMRVDDSQMYSLTVPYDVNLSDITYWDGASMGTLGDNLWISAYDGQARANKQMNKTWIYEADFEAKLGAAKLIAGKGYTISANMQSGVGADYSIIRMPMKSNVGTNATEAAKTVAVTAYANTEGIVISDNNKGWNLVGNPYMASISGGEADTKLVVGYLRETGTGPWVWVNDTYRYVTIPHDDGTDYYQAKFSSVELKPFKNFFLQIATTGDLSFALASRRDMPARFIMLADKKETEFEIELSNSTSEDHTGLLLGDDFSPAYEINADLEKLENRMSVYTLTGGYRLAYNALSYEDAKQPIPVGYISNKDDTYVFHMADDSDVSGIKHIWLTDYELDITVDLLQADYDFTTPAERNETRFALVVEMDQNAEIATGNLPEIEADEEQPVKFIYRNNMYIKFRGVIYDSTGKQVSLSK